MGKTFLELAAESYSQHRTQAYGAVAERGPKTEAFELLDGRPAKADLFEGIDCTWNRVPGGPQVGLLLAQARKAYRPDQPDAVVPLLLQAKAALDRLGSDPWAAVKRVELLEAIRGAAGIWLEAIAERQTVTPGDSLGVTTTLIARADGQVALTGYGLGPGLGEREKHLPLSPNQPIRESFQVTLPPGTPCSQPYWLGEPRTEGLHAGGAPDRAGLPENPPALTVTFHLAAHGVAFDLTAPVQYRFRDPVLGERYQPLAVVPPVLVTVPQPVQILTDGGARQVTLMAEAGGPRVTDENAAMTFLAPDHPVLNCPNRITAEDFQGWVQERGTYFAWDWDPRFVPILACADPSEPPNSGCLIVAPHGQGWFVYTGLSFFRQLPAGVPGAYRLLANLLALGKQ